MNPRRSSFGKRSFHAGANPTAGGLVTHGPFRYLRHPIYAAATYVVWTGVLQYRSTLTISIGMGVTLYLTTRSILEERLLNESYPEYEECRKRTKRLIPFLF